MVNAEQIVDCKVTNCESSKKTTQSKDPLSSRQTMYKSLDRSKSDEDIRLPAPKIRTGKSTQSVSLPITPQKQTSICVSSEDPLTPTSNLKMLVSAAFGIACARDEGKQKRELFIDNDDCEFHEDSCSTVSDSTDDKHDDYGIEDKKSSSAKEATGTGRKLKSLGLLCQKFLNKYPEGSEGATIFLHDVAKELNVERRRIYDIVNVLESLEYVSKQGKNTYCWHGSKRLIPTLSKLKALAIKIYGDKESASDAEMHGNIEQNLQQHVPPLWLHNGIMIGEQELDACDIGDAASTKQDDDAGKRRSKSLGIFCQKLIMLFIVAKNPVIALEEAAKEIIEGAEDPPGKTKTKVRRLYDIANILTSMQLIEKTGSRKAAFKWIGVDLNSLQPDTETIEQALSGSNDYIPTKHSLFSLPSSLEIPKGISSVRKFESRSLSANNITIQKKNKMPRTKSAAMIINRKRSSIENAEDKGEISKSRRKEQTLSLPGNIKKENESKGVAHRSIDTGRDETEEMALQGSNTESPKRIQNIKRDLVSPNERCFREEIKKLQERFPDKLQNADGLLNLLTAHNELQKNEVEKDIVQEKGSRCCLMERLGGEDSSVPREHFGKGNLLEGSQLEIAPQVKSVTDSNCKSLSKSCLDVIMDQVKGRNNTVTIRNEIEKATKVPSAGNAKDKSFVQKTSVGIQASLLNGVSPLKVHHSTAAGQFRKRKANFDEWLSHNPSELKTEHDWKNITEPVRIPVYSKTNPVCFNSPNASSSTKHPLFLVSLKQKSPNLPNRSIADAIACLKSTNSLPLSLLAQSRNVPKPPKLEATPEKKDGVVEMVRIPPTLINIRSGMDNKENIPNLETSPRSLNSSTEARIILPFQIIDSSVKQTSPILLPKGNQCFLNEETPLREDIPDEKAHRIQRQLSSLRDQDI